MPQRLSRNTFVMNNPPTMASFAAVVGKKEGEGPLASCFDLVNEDTRFGQDSYEKAESEMQKQAVELALKKGNFKNTDIDLIFAGDLLNQCIGSSYGLRELEIPFVGLYGACSTMAESIAMASIFVDSAITNNVVAVTSSHFCSAERQFRFPLEYGSQRTPTAQWTATGSGSTVINSSDAAPFIRAVTIGKITDLGVTDINNMGAAMAPATSYTIATHLKDTGKNPNDFDLILTGDLGLVGSELLIEILQKENIDISKNHSDCGLMLYDIEKQDVHAGGSGCGCSASVLCGFIADKIKTGQLKNVLFVATGALMSPTSVFQGESIPSIAHAVHISNTKS